MACQDIVAALVFMAVVGAFAADSSPSLAPSKAKKGSSSDAESPEEVLSPPSPTTDGEVSDSPTPSPKSNDEFVDNESPKFSNDSPAPEPSNSRKIKAFTGIAERKMARQDLLVVALVFIDIVGAFASHSSPSPAHSKASSPTKSPSSSSSASSPKSSSNKSSTPSSNNPSPSQSKPDGGAPKSSPIGAPKSSSKSLETKKESPFYVESLEEVSSHPSPIVANEKQKRKMARQDLIVVALVFIAVVGAFATDKSPSPAPSKAFSPAKSPSSSSTTSFTKSSFNGRAPKSSPIRAPKSFSSFSSLSHSKSDSPDTKEGCSFNVESIEDVSSPPSPNVTDKVLSILYVLKSKADAVDSESPNSNNNSPAPAPFNSDATKAIIGIVNIVVVTGFFLF
ncbi:hypothetical protein CXB51_008976 [Gossypium anomalum]|uniref:Uncharacterized protein n=1 Tax=Gossypium anomalum TaxID=47600 RepID=A0A8J5Z0E9_9ROSI|nr:hypothetical protein CXB51_008976 [Gossypium anomalum]